MNNNLFLKGADIPIFQDFLNLMKEKRLKARIETTIINRNLRKNGCSLLLLEEIYTIREFAIDLECNYNSFRKFISGNGGNIKSDILGRLENLKKENSSDERRIGLINIDVAPCPNCGGVHTRKCSPRKKRGERMLTGSRKEIATMIACIKFFKRRKPNE